jgi:predicted HicB family RNase H-like nuclease
MSGATSARSGDKTKVLSLRIRGELRDQVVKAAEERGVNVNWLLTKAIEDFLPRLKPANEFRLTREDPK